MILIMKATEFADQSAAFKKRFADVEELYAAGWWLQPKYDGCFGMAVLRADGDSRMLSRTGEDYSASCGHILAALDRAAFQIDSTWTELVVLGEVWHPEWEFPKISGSMRRRAPAPELVFVAHDLLPIHMNTPASYKDRWNTLRTMLTSAPLKPLMLAHNVRTLGVSAVRYANDLKAQGGYDGAVLKDPDAGYSIGNVRLGQIVKVKPTQSLDLKITGTQIEAGKKTGRDVYTFSVEYRGVHTWVGSGVPHDYIPAIDQIVEVEFMGFTPDGLLREPRFKGVRFDKTQPDA
jgi:DNA ligase-1